MENSYKIKKIGKFKMNLVGFPVSIPTSFAKHDPLLTNSFCMKN
jgi:hypothetical protein